jgi:hypothetical protein
MSQDLSFICISAREHVYSTKFNFFTTDTTYSGKKKRHEEQVRKGHTRANIICTETLPRARRVEEETLLVRKLFLTLRRMEERLCDPSDRIKRCQTNSRRPRRSAAEVENPDDGAGGGMGHMMRWGAAVSPIGRLASVVWQL